MFFQEKGFLLKTFFDVWDPPNFPYMPNTGKCLLRNHFQGKCFPSKIFSDESKAGPRRVSVKFRVDPEQVPINSQAGGEQLGKSQAGLEQVPIESQAGLG
jgi:hypothetical protein